MLFRRYPRIEKLIHHRRISTPRTKYTKDPIDTVPMYGLSRMKKVIHQAFPELAEFGFTDSRVFFDFPFARYTMY